MATKESLMRGETIARFIDHTLLKATASPKEISHLCSEAQEFGFFSVCLPSCYVAMARDALKGSSVKICTVAGFPLGNSSTEAKVTETKTAIAQGAQEVDMVLNIGQLKAGLTQSVKTDIEKVVQAAGDAKVKVILETCYLDNNEVMKACELSAHAGAAFVKTSTGFGTAGAKTEHVQLMRQVVGDKMGVKASGGIRDIETLMQMLEAGANRIGCSSGVEIIKGLKGNGY